MKQRSEVAIGKCVGRQDLRRKRGTSGFSAGAEICLSSVAPNSLSSSTNILQVLHFCVQAGPLELVAPDNGNSFELSMDDIECAMTTEGLTFFTGNAQVLFTTLLWGISHNDGLGNDISFIASAF